MTPEIRDEQHEVPIWDLPTRLFHWSLAALVGCNLFLVSPRGGLHTLVHFLSGFAVAGLLLFRLLWGFIGSPRARFADFLLPWCSVRAYMARLIRLAPPHSIGHNPLGGWMIGALLVTLTAMIGSGMFSAGRRAAGPFAHLLPAPLAERMGHIHWLISNLLIGLLAVHVAGVLADWVLTRNNLIKAMITGRKILGKEAAANEPALAPLSRAVVVALLSLILIAVLISITNFGTP
jgi:cytochrome b